MTETTATSDELMDQLRLTPWGTAHRELANRVIALAQERGDEALEFDARQQLVEHGVMRGATDLALANFAWCAAKYSERPAWFDDRPGRAHEFFWQHKWMPNRLSDSPAFSADQIREVLDEMDERFRDAGLGRSAVVTARFEAAMRLRDYTSAQRWADELRELPDDDYSSCSACVPGDYVELALGQGDEAQAVELAVKTWRDGESCVTEPARTLASVLIAMLRQGRAADAVEAFQQVRDDLDTERDQVEPLALCAQFASVTGNHDLALGLLERHLGWLAQDALDEDGHFHAAMAFAVVLDRAVRAHEGSTLVVRASADPALAPFLGEVAGPRSADELASALWAVVDDLGAQFDERNGTDDYARAIAQSRALVDEEHPVPIEEAELFAPISVAAPMPSTATEWWTRALAARYVQDGRLAMDAAAQALALADDSSDSLLLRWSAHHIRHSIAAVEGDDDAASRAAAEWIAFARDHFGPQGEQLAALEIEPGHGDALANAARDAAALPVLLRAAGMVAAASAHGNSAELTAEVADWMRSRLDEAEQLSSTVDSDGSEIIQVRLVVIRTAVHLLRSTLAAQLDQDAETALGHLDLIDSQSAPALADVIAATAASARGRVIYSTGDQAGAAQAHEQAATAFSRAGFWAGAHHEAVNACQLRLWNGEGPEALARIEYALSLRPVDEPTPTGLRWLHAQALLAAGEADRAEPLLVQILEEEQAAGAAPENMAETHQALARAYEQDSDERAGEQYGHAARLYAEAAMHREAASASVDQATALRYTVGYEPAYAALERAEAHAAQAGDARLDLLVCVTRAEMRIVEPSDGWRADTDRAIELARSFDDPTRESQVLARLSDACAYADNTGGAIEFREQQIDAVRRMGDTVLLADVVTDLAYALRHAGRNDEAYTVLARLWDERESLTPEALALLVEYSGSILDSVGRAHEWQTWKAQIE